MISAARVRFEPRALDSAGNFRRMVGASEVEERRRVVPQWQSRGSAGRASLFRPFWRRRAQWVVIGALENDREDVLPVDIDPQEVARYWAFTGMSTERAAASLRALPHRGPLMRGSNS